MTVTAPEILLKQPGERRRFEMDFSALLSNKEELSDPVVTVDKEGLEVEDPVVSGQSVLVWISAGIHNVKYRVQITVTTSAGQVLQGDGILKVGNN